MTNPSHQRFSQLRMSVGLVLILLAATLSIVVADPAFAGPPPEPGGETSEQQNPGPITDSAQTAVCTKVLGSPAAPSAPLTQKHCDALGAIYNSTGGATWSSPWLAYQATPVDPCSFYGITCDSQHGVVRIDLGLTGLVGALPTELGDLEELTYLSVPWNAITAVPASIGKLHKLEELHLGLNELTTLPDTFNTMTSLEVLDLSSNDLSTLPPSIGYLPSLTALRVSASGVPGEGLNSIPASFANLTTLTELQLNGHDFTTLPPLSTYTQLETLSLRFDKLSFPVSVIIDEAAANLPNLTQLNLYGNGLYGEVPQSILSLPLGFLDLRSNGCLTASPAVKTYLEALPLGNGNATKALNVGDDCPDLLILQEPFGPLIPWEDPTDPIGPVVREPVVLDSRVMEPQLVVSPERLQVVQPGR